MRDLARELRINPATVAKAYQRLTEAGVLTVRRGDGTYVADKPPAMSKAERARLLREAAVRYASLAATLGVTRRGGRRSRRGRMEERSEVVNDLRSASRV